ncbi:Phage infection protein-like protein [Bifidobacterium margollesii]|uniref:Phage infection protein-like protein n=1 Tax=Bifidobacterium margollesii TaxID=2020964 RepID=A0A2N5JC91_9BIFI|nr:YhgE/Pip domain-containing protein [Bifidobacterium margollesii]PLS31824.1 Phage infection protein-like protein [Bifidobacterium margollesii]
MRNVLRVVRRDLLRLLRVPAAWVICAGLIVIPSLYAWFNIVGFWDPYGNTSKIQVAVANEDAGASNDVLGDINLGDQIEASIKENHDLGWHFVTSEQALDEVKSGKSYAAFIIPKDFSSDLTTLLTGDFRQPKLIYYANEKANAIAPKITDIGSGTLDRQINSTFVSTVSEVAATTLNKEMGAAEGKITSHRNNVSSELNGAIGKIRKARGSIAELNGTVSDAKRKTADAKTSLDQVRAQTDLLTASLKTTSGLLNSTQTSMTRFSTSMSGTLDTGTGLLSQASNKANASVGKASGTIAGAQGKVDAAISTGEAITARNDEIIGELRRAATAIPADTAAGHALKHQLQAVIDGDQSTGQIGLAARNETTKQTLKNLGQLSTDTGNTADAVANATGAINTATQHTIDTANGYRNTLGGTTLPQINGGLAGLSSTASTLSATISNQRHLIDQTGTILDQLDSTLDTTGKALKSTDSTLANMQKDLETARTDVSALTTSDVLGDLIGTDGKLDADKISEFMLSPTTLKTETLYPVNSYGSGMAPLFTDLSLWVGAFVLMVIMRLETDDEGIEGLTVTQRYMGRWLLLAMMATLQAIVCCIGNFVIGVQAANAWAFVGTAVITSLTYLSITYALSVTFQHVGKGLCVVLVIVQIPGASGLYPIEMMPGFFRHLYPFFPFTYSIDALRETIGGFYDGHWFQYVGKLLLFVAASFALGLIARPYLTNLNRLFAREIAESDIIVGEQAEIPYREYRFSQAIRMLADRDEYRAQIRRRAIRFARRYPRLRVGALIAGFVVPAVLAVVFSVSPYFRDASRKVIILGAWTLWILIILGFLIAIEYIRDNIERQLLLSSMKDDEVRSMFSFSMRDKLLKVRIPSLPSFGRKPEGKHSA